MSNHNLVKVANSTPNTIWNWEQYTESNRLSLGTISVERACARFDFKASSYPTTEATNTYVLESTNGVKVLLGGAGVRKVVQQRLGRRGCHRGPHVVDILDPCITHPPNGS